MKNRRIWIFRMVLIFLIIGLFYLQSTGKTTELVKIMEINENSMLVHNMGGRVTRVYFDTKLNNILDSEDSYYLISYKYSIIERPKLIKITFFK
ncbi:hypothetical protein DFP94_1076 [Fontibacillus phaseoli]|uniref:Uncharacterized protein n=1 Tax=Fontibacillus phaseoli TaxID=1416533 RepID=A0A369B9Q9_9BACL|nr:hypothetical protein DFP94_1076 [Fontibacillus phaseoli]